MKKLVVMILIIMMLLVISGCTSKSNNTNNDYGQDPEEKMDINMILYEIFIPVNIYTIDIDIIEKNYR